MSVHKLLSRLISPKHAQNDDTDDSTYEQTYGIASDALMQFTVVLSALIHDLDHQGVPNAQVAKEHPRLQQRYKGKSVAEHNSFDLAWDVLMCPKFGNLRAAIAPSEPELGRFRQIMVNSVMATDIFDKELAALRKKRWTRAFDDATAEEQNTVRSLKATIVMEHLLQASDVAHTMQHWHVYQKWNQRLFNEMYRAFLDGRSDTDPSIGWYEGELGFFDHYIIPLAKKLKDCGVFGVCSDEYLKYAMDNRSEWADKGKAVVRSFLTEYRKSTDVARTPTLFAV
jgi:3'5'-cyclic nucleotide phosphodiesterase